MPLLLAFAQEASIFKTTLEMVLQNKTIFFFPSSWDFGHLGWIIRNLTTLDVFASFLSEKTKNIGPFFDAETCQKLRFIFRRKISDNQPFFESVSKN